MENKNILITGAATRIGKAIAIHFAEKGWNIGLHYNKSSLKAKSLKKIIDDSKLSCNFKSSVSFEHDPYGMFESIMSIIFKKSNIFTNFLMGIGRFSFRIPLIVLFGALLFLPIVTFSALSWIFNKGAIMEARAKKI